MTARENGFIGPIAVCTGWTDNPRIQSFVRDEIINLAVSKMDIFSKPNIQRLIERLQLIEINAPDKQAIAIYKSIGGELVFGQQLSLKQFVQEAARRYKHDLTQPLAIICANIDLLETFSPTLDMESLKFLLENSSLLIEIIGDMPEAHTEEQALYAIRVIMGLNNKLRNTIEELFERAVSFTIQVKSDDKQYLVNIQSNCEKTKQLIDKFLAEAQGYLDADGASSAVKTEGSSAIDAAKLEKQQKTVIRKEFSTVNLPLINALEGIEKLRILQEAQRRPSWIDAYIGALHIPMGIALKALQYLNENRGKFTVRLAGRDAVEWVDATLRMWFARHPELTGEVVLTELPRKLAPTLKGGTYGKGKQIILIALDAHEGSANISRGRGPLLVLFGLGEDFWGFPDDLYFWKILVGPKGGQRRAELN